jgi:ribosomal protein S1
MTDFGAFVDLGGIEGLIHVSEISWERVGHPRDLLHLGQELQVSVISIEPASIAAFMTQLP